MYNGLLRRKNTTQPITTCRSPVVDPAPHCPVQESYSSVSFTQLVKQTLWQHPHADHFYFLAWSTSQSTRAWSPTPISYSASLAIGDNTFKSYGLEALDCAPYHCRPHRGAVTWPGAERTHDVAFPPSPTFSLAGQQVKSCFIYIAAIYNRSYLTTLAV